jgi:pyruvate/2-oxoglutarate/acetoin dehydrogenase E1 component
LSDDKRTVASAHSRIDGIDMGMIELRTEQRIQFKDLYNRVKRTEQILWAAAGSIIALLIAVLMKVG